MIILTGRSGRIPVLTIRNLCQNAHVPLFSTENMLDNIPKSAVRALEFSGAFAHRYPYLAHTEDLTEPQVKLTR